MKNSQCYLRTLGSQICAWTAEGHADGGKDVCRGDSGVI